MVLQEKHTHTLAHALANYQQRGLKTIKQSSYASN